MRRIVCLLLVVLAAGCSDAPKSDTGQPEVVEPFDPACYNCHGNSVSPAPPRGLGGVMDLSAAGVGAHRSHLGGLSTWHASVKCESCHVVPTEMDSPGHIDDGDSKAELTFSALASTGGLSPALNADHTCSNVYCHGATLSGGSLNQPKWTQVDGTQKACGTCHGNPPPLPHPQSTDCGSCHPSMQAGTETFLDPGRHINGTVDLGDGTSCVDCHGSGQNSAPPKDLVGNTDRAALGVGAHRQHLDSSPWRRTLACANCHVVPSANDSPGHLDGDNRAEVPFDGLNPIGAFDRPSGTCKNMYCHGDGTGSTGTVSWVSTTPMACGSCHGNPPPAPHPVATDCGTCHQTMLPGTNEFRDPLRHIDGIVDVSTDDAACDSCHGSAGLSAPPIDLIGNSERVFAGVGAHRKHLGASTWRREVPCGSCHVVPEKVSDAGHRDGDNVAEVRFVGVDSTGAYSAASATCTNLFCHGDGTAANGTAVWTSTTEMTCTSCHGNPPPAPHPSVTGLACSTCHPNVAAGSSEDFSDPAAHINGVVNVNAGASCDSCHGSGGIAAPPKNLAGVTTRTARGVGAHREHLEVSTWSRAIECSSCHLVPDDLTSPGHLDGDNVAEVPFDGLNPAATVNFVNGTCNNLYCHGNGKGSNGTASWVSTTDMSCGSCHGNPPPAPHPAMADCGVCHQDMTPGTTLFGDPQRHIDGVVDVTSGACDSCHGSGGVFAPPKDLAGHTSRSFSGVGAHRQHLGASAWRREVVCSSCHVVPTGLTSVGHLDGDNVAEVRFTGVDAPGSFSGATDSCQNLYCHGNGKGANGNLSWTSTTAMTCTSCHANPPPAPHPPSAATACGGCHPNVQIGSTTFVDAASHINGVVDVNTGLACDSCHGSSGNPAPPTNLAGSSSRGARGVGSHREHLTASSWRRSMSCTTCHAVPADVSSPGHLGADNVAEVTFDGLNPAATVNFSNGTCANLYCHGNGKGSNGSATFTSTADLTCTSCHGNPPPLPHPVQTDCGVCHQIMVQGTTQFSDPQRHVDGILDVTSGACDSCHGAGGISAPPVDLAGNTSRASSGVGAHRQHLGASNWRKEVLCTTCHVVPATMASAGHLDGDNSAEVRFLGVDVAGAFNGATSSCQNLYCHGNGKGANGNISWTSTTPMTCSSCHANPPPSPHPGSAANACGSCHPNVQLGTATFSDPASHINGVLNVNAGGACDSCHGSGGDSSPPKNLAGSTARTARGVGAHREHLRVSSWARTMACTTCHLVPENVSSPGHLDGNNIAEVAFDGLNPSGTVDFATGTCNNLYCHGTGLGNTGSISFTSTTPMACGSCHKTPATGQSATGMSGDHDKHIRDKKINCVECHAQVINSSRVIIDKNLHLNGIKNVLMPKGGTYTASTRRCSNMACHGAKTW